MNSLRFCVKTLSWSLAEISCLAVGLLFGSSAIVAQQPILELEMSDDGMVSWQPVPITEAMITADGTLQLEGQDSSSGYYRLDIKMSPPPPPAGMVLVSGGTLSASSEMGAVAVETFRIARTPSP